MKPIAVGFCCAAILGCGGADRNAAPSPAIAPSAVKSPKIEPQAADASTPDKAIKSYWAISDFVQMQRNQFGKSVEQQYRESEKPLATVTTKQLFVSRFDQDSAAAPETFVRDIIEVKVESESRAVILTMIKNTTPIPAGAEVSKFDEERRRGEKFRYVLERDQTGWKVAEVWSWRDYDGKFFKLWPGDGKPSVPSSTFGGA